jgi:hypothetical protein
MTLDLAQPRPAEARGGRSRLAAPALSTERLLPLAAGSAAFGVYVATLAPTISLLDSPELSAAAITLGVPHPTGYPLFIALGHLWASFVGAIAGGDPAWRLNLLTALFAAGAVATVAAVGRRLTGRASAGWLAAGVLAFSPGFWAQANVVEVYALHVLFAASLLWLWLGFEQAADSGDDPRRSLRALAFVTGLSFTHHLMTVLVLPTVAYSVLRHRRSWWSAREAGVLCALGLAPLLLYVYLPIVASSDPLVNWGNPESLSALWHHVSGAQYHHNVGASDGSAIDVLFGYAGHLTREIGIVFLPLAMVGCLLPGRSRHVAVGLGVGFLVALAFGLSYGVVDSEPFYLNAHLIVALWVGAGAAMVLDRLQERSAQTARIAEALVWLGPAIALASGFTEQDRRVEYQPHDHAIAALASLPENAVLITQGPAGYPPVYAQLVENVRPDVAVVDMYLNVRGSYGPELDLLRQSRMPEGVSRELALTETVASLDGGSRSLWLMPGVPDNPWSELGLHRLRGGVIEPLVRTLPDLRAETPAAEPLAAFARGFELLGVHTTTSSVESGSALALDYYWRLGEPGSETPTVTLVFADEAGDAPTGANGLPLLEQKHPLGRGVPLASYAPGQVIRETLDVLVPRSIEPGTWWVWISLREGEQWLELQSGALFARALPVEVTTRVRPLWVLPGE